MCVWCVCDVCVWCVCCVCDVRVCGVCDVCVIDVCVIYEGESIIICNISAFLFLLAALSFLRAWLGVVSFLSPVRRFEVARSVPLSRP